MNLIRGIGMLVGTVEKKVNLYNTGVLVGKVVEEFEKGKEMSINNKIDNSLFDVSFELDKFKAGYKAGRKNVK